MTWTAVKPKIFGKILRIKLGKKSILVGKRNDNENLRCAMYIILIKI